MIFTSCENEELLSVDSAYKELLVVQSEIIPGSIFPGVRLTKTLPLGIPYDINLSEIKDATIYIRIDSIKIIPLHYTAEGLYKPLYDLPVSSGEYYELFGERGDQTFYAKTKIPYQPNLENVFFTYLHYAVDPTEAAHAGLPGLQRPLPAGGRVQDVQEPALPHRLPSMRGLQLHRRRQDHPPRRVGGTSTHHQPPSPLLSPFSHLYASQVLCSECNQRCTRCSKPLLNECLIVNDRQYHQGCHTCLRCNVALGEECYVLDNDNDVACRKCAEEVQAMREVEK